MTDHAEKGARRSKLIFRRFRRVIYLLVVVSIAWFFYKYDLYTIPDDYDHLSPQHMPAGSRVVLTEFDDETVIGIGTVVLYLPPGREDSRCFGVVAGLPGELIELNAVQNGHADIVVGDRKESLELPEGHRLKPGVIPEGSYLLFNGDRHLFSGVLRPDSRIYGLIPADRFVSKVVTPLYFFN